MSSWIAIASANHVETGRKGGFMQVCHGKSAPLARTSPNDTVIYYSPSTEMGGGGKMQAFTAAGRIVPGGTYQVDMGGGFVPWRRDVAWFDTVPAPIHPLLEKLEFTKGKRNWGYQFRFGLFAVSELDCSVILHAMGLEGTF